MRGIPEKVGQGKTWQWLTKGVLKVCRTGTGNKNQLHQTPHFKSNDNPLCRLCGKRGETVHHVIFECEKLAQKEYKGRHNKVAKKVHGDLCKRSWLECTEKWYEHNPEGVVQNKDIKILWDINVQCDNVIQARRPDIIVVDKKKKEALIIDIAIPADIRRKRKWKK